jgi:hypothetical protein
MAANGIPTFAQFKRSLAGTPMSGEARGIYNAALRGNLNPAFVSGLASAESSYGTKGYARGKYNPYGLGVHLGWKFKNYSEATSKLAKTLSGLGYPSLYERGGLAGIVSQYTPNSDPRNNEAAHARNIIAGGRRAGGDASRVYAEGASVPMQEPVSAAPMAPIVQQETQGATGFQFDPAELIRQYQRSRSGEVTPEEMRQTTLKMARAAGSAFGKQAMGQNVNPFGERTPSPSVSTSELATYSPTSFSVGGGPNRGTHTLGDWQSDMAYDLFAGAGAEVTNPYAGRVTNISGQPGGGAKGPRYAGYGVTVDYGGGRQAFYKHLGSLGQGIQIGAQLRPGVVIGGLDPATAGGPHLHLGTTSRDFLEQLKKYYTTAKKR